MSGEQILAKAEGISVPRVFTTKGQNVLDTIKYKKTSTKIAEPDGSVVFEMKDIEVPEAWSQLAADILASKYFRKAGVKTKDGSETSIRQVVHRIAHTIRVKGEQTGYFATPEDADAFESELSYLLVTQRGAFNSPVWFNCGLFQEYGATGSGGLFYYDPVQKQVVTTANAYEHPQCSACFIQSIDDDLMAIYKLASNEAKLFKYGSGTGTNFSPLRSKYEKLSGGGTSSGLMSFLEVFDRVAGATKSGGTTRRAAKMVCLDLDHPEILDFVRWKSKEEKKARALIAAGYPSDFNGEAYRTVAGQNSNNSVRITDKFMEAYQKGGKWHTVARTTGETLAEHDARFLMREIAQAAWECADPGVQFDTTVNDWHTCPNSDRIYASNPCSEYMFLNDSACNLASINLMLFADSQGKLNIKQYQHAIRTFIIAMEIIVELSSYPTEKIAQNSYEYRPLGLGYANLGTLLMVNGIAYDSPQALAWSGAISAILCGHAYKASAELAAVKGAFTGFAKNRDPMLRVMNKHRDAAYQLDVRHCPEDLLKASREDWDEAVTLGERFGYRNSQATVIAPTGTIGLLMDCATTGVEPEFSIVKFKKLAGGGYFKIINSAIPQALTKLGYTKEQVDAIIEYVLGNPSLEKAPHIKPQVLKGLGFTEDQIKEAQVYLTRTQSLDQWCPITPAALKAKGLSDQQIKQAQVAIAGAQTIEGAPFVKEEHYAVFDCANRCGEGKRFIDPMGHVKMMAAVQPFISGAISKTVNLPNDVTVEDIEHIYVESWRLGIKACALYRDGCKSSQPLNTQKESSKVKEELTGWGVHKPLPSSRRGLMMESNVAGNNIFIRTGEYEDGAVGEVAVELHKEGSAVRAFMGTLAKSVSIGLQHGAPLQKYVDALTFTRFEPNGFTNHPHVKTCTSLVDYMFRVLGVHYLGRDDLAQVKPQREASVVAASKAAPSASIVAPAAQKVAPAAVSSNVDATNNAGKKSGSVLSDQLSQMMGDAPACNGCGHITVRNGTCYKCLNCGNSMGCS